MKGKNVIITGGNDGIGFSTALELARRGANIILVCRNEAKAKAAADNIKATVLNENVNYVLADLASQQSIRLAASEINARMDKIDVLINNAGGTFAGFELTADGLEKTIATNHFAYFLLTGLLLKTLQKADAPRVICVGSHSHYRGKIDFDSFTMNKNYFVLKAYEQSKLANALFSRELAERTISTQLTANCLHPGFVKTRIGSKSGHIASFLWTFLTTISGMNPQKGAETSVFLAASENVAGVTGKYFAKCKEAEVNPLVQDAALRKKLWEVSEKLSGFTYPV